MIRAFRILDHPPDVVYHDQSTEIISASFIAAYIMALSISSSLNGNSADSASWNPLTQKICVSFEFCIYHLHILRREAAQNEFLLP